MASVNHVCSDLSDPVPREAVFRVRRAHDHAAEENTVPHQRHFSFLLSLTLLAAALLAGCRSAVVEPPYQPTQLPSADSELFEVFGNAGSDTVWIFEQGGPVYELDGRWQAILRSIPAFAEVLDTVQVAQAHQVQSLNPGLASRHEELPFEDVQAEVDVSVEILDRTIRHFRSQGKQVVVIGFSYGAFVTARYLWRKGPDAADRYVMVAGRLDMPQKVVDAFRNRMAYYFPDAVNPQPASDPVPADQPYRDQELMRRRIMAATGHERYTERLAGVDLSKVIYAYGIGDTRVGRLSDAELQFLNSKGSMIIPVQADHGRVFPAAASQIAAALSE